MESNIQKDNGDHNPPAMAKALPPNVESNSGESPPLERKNMSSKGNNSNNLGEFITSPPHTLLLLAYDARLFCPLPMLVDYLPVCMYCRPMVVDCLLAICMEP